MAVPGVIILVVVSDCLSRVMKIKFSISVLHEEGLWEFGTCTTAPLDQCGFDSSFDIKEAVCVSVILKHERK